MGVMVTPQPPINNEASLIAGITMYLISLFLEGVRNVVDQLHLQARVHGAEVNHDFS